MLGVVLKLVLLIGLLFVSFGPNYSFVLFDVVYGKKWSSTEAPAVLAWYCLYILCIAANGVLEAFLFAAISRTELHSYNRYMIGFSAVYLTAAVLLVPFGARGAVWANCLNMIIRIVYSAMYVARLLAHYRATDDVQAEPIKKGSTAADVLWTAALPAPFLVAAFAGTFAITATSFHTLQVADCNNLICYAKHVLTGIVALVGVIVVGWITERTLVSQIRDLVRRKRT